MPSPSPCLFPPNTHCPAAVRIFICCSASKKFNRFRTYSHTHKHTQRATRTHTCTANRQTHAAYSPQPSLRRHALSSTPHITHSRSPSLVLYWKFARTVCTVVQCSGHGAHFAGHVTQRPPPQRPHCTAAKGDGASAAARATLTATATAKSTASAAAVLSVAQQ